MRNKASIFTVVLTGASLVFLLLTIVPASAQSEYGQIEKIWSLLPHYTWIGPVESPPGNVTVTVNSTPVEQNDLVINNYTGTGHVKVPLVLGESSLIVISDGENVVFTAEVMYASTYEGGLVPEEYEIRPFHSERFESSCRDCHLMDPEVSDAPSENPTLNVCYACHKEQSEGFSIAHGEAGVMLDCMKCHQTERMETDFSIDGPVRFNIKEGVRVAPLCYRCHEDKEKQHTDFKYVHGPVAMGGCSMCHNPHGSDMKNILQKETSTLCIDCHRMKDVLKKSVVHPPVVKKGCISCHNPHGSNYPFFLSATVKELCLGCHPKTQVQKQNHPVTGHPVSGARNPLAPEQPFSCVSCHNPHAAEFDKMLPVNEIMMLCTFCHTHGS